MAHPFRVRDIARQSGLSEATVDRVLHGRAGVRDTTVAEVRRAVADLERQRDQLRLVGRTFLLDLVMQAPQRFSAAVRAALEAELPGQRPAAVRARFHLREQGSTGDLVAVLDRIARRGSDGVLLKAPDEPEVRDAIGRLADRGVPVVTLVTDVPASRRIGYVGIDNHAAGATAAYLLARLAPEPRPVLVTLSRSSFRGEEQREVGFRATLADLAPGRRLVELTDTDGLDDSMLDAASAVLRDEPALDAVYSIGGGNHALLAAFDRCGRRPACFVAHDLDGENAPLLRRGRLTVVLHHDLRADLRTACRLVLHAHDTTTRRPSAAQLAALSVVQVVTPYNEPTRLDSWSARAYATRE